MELTVICSGYEKLADFIGVVMEKSIMNSATQDTSLSPILCPQPELKI